MLRIGFLFVNLCSILSVMFVCCGLFGLGDR